MAKKYNQTSTDREPIPAQNTRFSKPKARDIAFLVHDRLHLTFPQMVHGLVKGNLDAMRAVANRNIIASNKSARLYNATAPEHLKRPILTPYDPRTFRDRYDFEVDFALSAHKR